MNYENYCKICKILNEYDISTYELDIIDDVLCYFDDYVGSDNYNKDTVIKEILQANYSYNTNNFERYCEIKDKLNIKEV